MTKSLYSQLKYRTFLYNINCQLYPEVLKLNL